MPLLDEVDDTTTGAGLTGLLLEPIAWHKDARCADADPELFFPERGGSSKEARSYCQRCPVVQECLSYALENKEAFGRMSDFHDREAFPECQPSLSVVF